MNDVYGMMVDDRNVMHLYLFVLDLLVRNTQEKVSVSRTCGSYFDCIFFFVHLFPHAIVTSVVMFFALNS